MKLSILLPVFGETESVKQTVERIFDAVNEFVYEILIIISPRFSKESFGVCYKMEGADTGIKVHIQRQNP